MRRRRADRRLMIARPVGKPWSDMRMWLEIPQGNGDRAKGPVPVSFLTIVNRSCDYAAGVETGVPSPAVAGVATSAPGSGVAVGASVAPSGT